MKVLWMGGILAIGSVLTMGFTDARKSVPRNDQAVSQKLTLHDARTSPSDLELAGDVPGASAYSGRYLAYDELLTLPQVTFTVTDDPNFSGKTVIAGVYLDELMQVFKIPEENTLVAAVCDDGYEAHYPIEYRAAHHPILVLKIDGKPPALGKRMGEGGSYGPYLVSHPSFTSRYRTLAHPEEAQIPNGVLELRFIREDEALHAIEPHGHFAANSPQMEGYLIARENCFRCHNAGIYGGLKAGITWKVLGKIATKRPAYFKAYIKDPESESAYAEMPGFPDYDGPTLAALAAYFQVIPMDDVRK